jgi:hypothetical protein
MRPCTVGAGELSCTATGLTSNTYVALNVDLQDRSGLDYGIDGIADGTTDASGAISFAVDLRQMQFFRQAPLPAECLGEHVLMVAYWDGYAVATDTVVLSY